MRVPDMRCGGRRLPELPETMRSLFVEAGRKGGDSQVEASIAAAHAFGFELWQLASIRGTAADFVSGL